MRKKTLTRTRLEKTQPKQGSAFHIWKQAAGAASIHLALLGKHGTSTAVAPSAQAIATGAHTNHPSQVQAFNIAFLAFCLPVDT